MRIWLVLAAACVLSGCTHIMLPGHSGSLEGCADRIAGCIAGGLEDSYKGISVLVGTPVDAVSFAPGDFGLALQELLIGALAEHKVNVLDVQLMQEPYISCRDGLIVLSRDADRIKKEFRAEAVIVSTYLVRGDEIVITSRAVDFINSDVIASTTVVLATTVGVGHLLRSRGQAAAYEK